MRDKLRALYYPDFWLNYPTLIKSILLFDEIHLMDRPSLTFDGQHLSIGAVSPIRPHEQWFRDQGVPLYVHEPPSGPVLGELREVTETDISDINFMLRFQEGLRSSTYFRNLHIQTGNYGNGETHETIFEKLSAIDLRQSPSLLDVHNNQTVRPYEFTNPESALKTFVSMAAFCSAKMNFALKIGVNEGFSPLADMAPYGSLLSAKYHRAVASPHIVGENKITATDLSLAIFDELVPAEILNKITVEDAIKYRRESQSARDAFLENLQALQVKLGRVSKGDDYAATINAIISTEVRPAARVFSNKLNAIFEQFLGKLGVAAVLAAAGAPAVVQIFGDVTLEKLLLLAIVPAASIVLKESVDAHMKMKAATRDCAFSYLLELEG